MYVTRPLSLLRKYPEALHEPPPPGPASGYLVIQDEDCDDPSTFCFMQFQNRYLCEPPFPQDRRLTIAYSHADHIEYCPCYFIPVVDQPLSSNRYYVAIGKGKHKGMVSTCSTKADQVTCCFRKIASDVEPTELDAMNIYQQMEILVHYNGHFQATSVSPDGSPQTFLRRPGWRIRGSANHAYPLQEALGIDGSLRARMPDLGFSGASSLPVAVGKWYCPYVFVREDTLAPADQVERSPYYEMTLEQFWGQIYECENSNRGRGNKVKVNTRVQTKRPLLHVQGRQAVQGDVSIVDRWIQWFLPTKAMKGCVGLRVEIVDRMRWEEERGGWDERNGIVDKEVEFDGEMNGWSKFTCYILVERFALRRMDGTLLLTYDFKHTDKITCKWARCGC